MNKKLVVITTVILLTALPARGPATGIPVLDVSNLTESIKHGLEQIRQFALQVQQLENEINTYKTLILQNTGIAAAAQIYQDVQRTYGQVMSTITGVQTFVNNYRDLNYWISSATAAGAAQYNQQSGYWSTAQQKANTQLAQTITQQGQQLSADAATLQRLQTQSGGTAGIKQSLDLANEMNALMSKQLMSLRTLMLSDQQAVAARNGAVTTNEAMGSATTQNLLNANPSVSQPHTAWSPVTW
jgi:P-type conjugative transfer protein TrbJ